MKLLCVGDVVGSAGCGHLRKTLPSVKSFYGVDVCLVNGENAADGNGITPAALEDLFVSGADVVTTGNHVFRRREIYDVLDRCPAVVRPANYPAGAPGKGFVLLDKGRYQVMVINLLGVVFLEPLACPFETLDMLLKREDKPTVCVVDFHAEASAEKKALAYFADGRISALYGTHTHVQTADEQILPGGTGYITDVGMTGPVASVLGIRPELAIAKMKEKLPVRFVVAEGPCMLNGILFDIDEKTGRTVKVERLSIL